MHKETKVKTKNILPYNLKKGIGFLTLLSHLRADQYSLCRTPPTSSRLLKQEVSDELIVLFEALESTMFSSCQDSK